MQLKDFFSAEIVQEIANDVRRVHAAFDASAFIRDATNGLHEHELIGRGKHISRALALHLPPAFPKAAAILVASLGPPLDDGAGNGMTPFKYLPHILYVQDHGLEHFADAMAAQRELTRRFSCEGSIRAYLLRHPRETYAQLEAWAGDEDQHVRRLVSEGTRPRLPWHARLPAFIADPSPVLQLLERLKDDPALYVRRSVANNLNDIAKDHPDVVVATCARWSKGATRERQWVIERALRTLVKRGHKGALSLLGVAKPPRVSVRAISLSAKRVRIGETLRFAFELHSAAKQDLLVDFRVHFVKANGTTSAKVFKLKRVSLAKGEVVELGAKISFAQHTTRKVFPGRHAIDLLINATPIPLATIELRK